MAEPEVVPAVARPDVLLKEAIPIADEVQTAHVVKFCISPLSRVP